MAIFLGVDIGTSSLAAVAINSEGSLVARVTVPNDSDVQGLPPGRHEQSPGRIWEQVIWILRGVSGDLGAESCDVRALGLTGQMHGVLICDRQLVPLSSLVTWRDRRTEDPLGPASRSCLEESLERIDPSLLKETGASWSAGYTGPTLFWLKETGNMPAQTRWALMCHDWVAARLARLNEPVTDPTNAASSGIFSLREWDWSAGICRSLGLDQALLPEIKESGEMVGQIGPRVARETGLPAGTTVHAGLGDNQASVLASLHSPAQEILVNVGTGAQVSTVTERVITGPDIEARPFPGRKILACGAVIAGGTAFQYLAEHYRAAVRELTNIELPLRDVLDKLVSLASGEPPGAKGLKVVPLFAGKRSDPLVRGRISGMSNENNSPGTWARAFLEGMAALLVEHYENMLELGLAPRRRLVGAGNAIRLNPVLRRAVQKAFQLPLVMPEWEEASACGAALAATVGTGLVPSFDEGARLVQYRD